MQSMKPLASLSIVSMQAVIVDSAAGQPLPPVAMSAVMRGRIL